MKYLKTILLFMFIFGQHMIYAKGKSIDLSELIKESKLIVIAEYRSSNLMKTVFHLKVESVLLGKIDNTTIKVKSPDNGTPYVRKNEKFIAFINKQNEFEWIGYIADLENDMVYLSGFYDYNSYDVWPSSLTFPQLKSYIETKKYSGTIHTELKILSLETLEYEPTDIYFDLAYKYTDDMHCSITSTNFEAPGFPDKPELSFWGNGFRITYDENNYHPLEFHGWTEENDIENNTHNGPIYVYAPDDISQSEFEEYITNSRAGYIYYEVEIKTPTDTYIFMDGDAKDNSRTYLITPEGNKIDYSSYNFPDDDDEGYFRFGDYDNLEVEILFPTVEISEQFERLTDYQRVQLQPLDGEFFEYRDGVRISLGPCTFRVKKKHFAVY
ncbi:MAG: hypothetical protein QNK23_05450 [Crocinitomicaceae bacterium]|nr:hypothetical protein [Crocinitomicaceae bacterium]